MDVLQKSSRGIAIARYCIHHLAEVRAPDMAAALSFRTLFGLVPVLFVATLAARSLAGDHFPEFVESLADMAGLNEIGIDAVVEGSSAVEQQPLSKWIEDKSLCARNHRRDCCSFLGNLVDCCDRKNI